LIESRSSAPGDDQAAPRARDDARRVAIQALCVALATALAFGVPFLAQQIALEAGRGWLVASPAHDGPFLAFLYLQHGLQALLALLCMVALRRTTGADFGLRWPPTARPVVMAAVVAFAVCCAFTLLAYLPNLLAGAPPPPPHPLSTGSIAGWSLFEGGFVGPTEEILFRALIIGYLATTLRGATRLGSLRISWATIIAAILFGLAHMVGAQGPWWRSAFQVSYAIVLGLIYGYWFERGRSLLAPAIAHNITDFAALAAGFAITALWR
jgi:hypothetical protein